MKGQRLGRKPHCRFCHHEGPGSSTQTQETPNTQQQGAKLEGLPGTSPPLQQGEQPWLVTVQEKEWLAVG